MDFVVLTLDAFNAMEETAYLLSTPANTARLMESIAQDKSGNVTAKQLDLGEKKPSGNLRTTRAKRKVVFARRSRK